MKKAAMFGLDARIALTIFGALSVISGAALYSAIQQSKVTAHLATLKEIEKAVEQYYLDTGVLPPVSTTSSTLDLSFYALVEKPSDVTGWNGPYISMTKLGSGDALNYKESYVVLAYRESDNSNNICKKTSSSCHVFIWTNINDMPLSQAMNALVDGDASNPALDLNGNLHYYAAGSHSYKTGLYFNPKNSPNT